MGAAEALSRCLLVVCFVSLTAGAVRAEEPFVWGPGDVDDTPAEGGETAPSGVLTPEEQTLQDLRARLEAGEAEAVAEEARALVRSLRGDTSVKKDALVLVADALRKAKDWRGAAGAYLQLRDAHDKAANAYLRYDAMAEVLRAAPEGVYGPMRKKAAGPDADPPTLDDDAVLEEALEMVAEGRLQKVKGMARGLGRARSPQDLVRGLAQVAEGFRQARAVAPGLPVEPERQAAKTADARMGHLTAAVGATLRAKEAAIQKAIAEKRVSNRHRKDAEACKAMCAELVRIEDAYQQALRPLGGPEWADRETMVSESRARRNRWEQSSSSFTIPESDLYDFGW